MNNYKHDLANKTEAGIMPASPHKPAQQPAAVTKTAALYGLIHSTIATRLQEEGAIGDVFSRCCLDPAKEPFYSPTIQERAWTSPIWIHASKE